MGQESTPQLMDSEGAATTDGIQANRQEGRAFVVAFCPLCCTNCDAEISQSGVTVIEETCDNCGIKFTAEFTYDKVAEFAING